MHDLGKGTDRSGDLAASSADNEERGIDLVKQLVNVCGCPVNVATLP